MLLHGPTNGSGGGKKKVVSDVSIYCNWWMEVVKTGNWFEGTSYWYRSRAVCSSDSSYLCTHPWQFGG
jgi:hypothetical protein